MVVMLYEYRHSYRNTILFDDTSPVLQEGLKQLAFVRLSNG
ncbi:MAG: hypothetical protein R2685_01140 [Candidatus Nitrosocosmicus sp.]